ncbi:MAG TPA: serine hydrolase, partial [Anaerolineae bacterium]|nr:serine hydrolase [Anaerolineae bacterium]
ATVSDIVNDINTEQSRILDLDLDPTTGNYNVVLVACTTNCPLWWWYVGSTGQQMLDNALQDGARPIDVNTYSGCGGTCYAYVLINNSNDITTRVGQLLRNGTDGTKGLYLKEVNGSVLANLEDNWVFEPASAIKAVLHVYAMHQVQLGITQLSNNVLKYAPPASGSCPGNTVNGLESLSTALGEMMRHSDNTRTREISDTFGVNNIIGYAQSFGMSNTHINHIIGCGGPIPNQTTLNDLGTLYEKVANGTLLNAANRSTFYSLMAGKAEYQLEGYDWTGLWSTDIPNIINQEAPLTMTLAQKQFFRNQMDLAYKAGNYKICGVTCATYVDHIAIAGWAQIPFCNGAVLTYKQYVFGLFINNSTSDTTSSATFNATKAELLREQIHDGLASCANFHQVFLPLTVK